MPEPLLRIRNFSVYYPIGKTTFFSTAQSIRAVADFSLDLPSGSITGLVGESGCGKSSLGRALVGLVSDIDGYCAFNGAQFDPRTSEEIRKQIQIIFQDPFGSLNPRQTIGQSLLEIEKVVFGKQNKDMVWDLLEAVQLPRESFNRYPHELSGGQRQRACIARALAVNPQVLICDEIVSSLDVSLQAKIINLLLDLRASKGLTLLFTTHDLKLVNAFCDQVAVMYLGRVVEQGTVGTVFSAPAHPYTIDLLSNEEVAVDPGKSAATHYSGSIEPFTGCVYQHQCSKWNSVEKQNSWQCTTVTPERYQLNNDHSIYCLAVEK